MVDNGLHIGMKAPDFIANSTIGAIKMSDYHGKWVVLFSHPGDFTPVCTTEFVAFAKENDKFDKKNAQLIGLSIDSNPSHLAWISAINTITGITIPFPVIADNMGEVAKMYGMIAPDISNHETVRNVFIIDPNQIIRAILIYPMTNGRNIDEILRLLTALQLSDETKAVTPANWTPGQATMAPAPQTYNQLMNRKQNPQDLGLECKDWFWCYNTNNEMINTLQIMVSSEEADIITNNLSNVNYSLNDLKSDVEDLISRIEIIIPYGTCHEPRSHFYMFSREIDLLEAEIDMKENEIKTDYFAGRITRNEFRDIDRLLNSLENRLDHAERLLEQIFGTDD